jgi:hypothetical protein
MSIFQIVKAASRAIQSRVSGQANPFRSRKSQRMSPAKNSPGVLHIYVTYDTFNRRQAAGVIARNGKIRFFN